MSGKESGNKYNWGCHISCAHVAIYISSELFEEHLMRCFLCYYLSHSPLKRTSFSMPALHVQEYAALQDCQEAIIFLDEEHTTRMRHTFPSQSPNVQECDHSRKATCTRLHSKHYRTSNEPISLPANLTSHLHTSASNTHPRRHPSAPSAAAAPCQGPQPQPLQHPSHHRHHMLCHLLCQAVAASPAQLRPLPRQIERAPKAYDRGISVRSFTSSLLLAAGLAPCMMNSQSLQHLQYVMPGQRIEDMHCMCASNACTSSCMFH